MVSKYFMWGVVTGFVLLTGCMNQPNGAGKNEQEKSGSSIAVGAITSEAAAISTERESVNIPVSASPGAFDQATYDALGQPEFAYGGANYDTWYVATAGATTPAANHPLWTGTSPDIANEGTWRCAQCHGWDYQGVDGIFGLFPDDENYSGICGIVSSANCPNTFATEQDVWTFLHDGGATPNIANPSDHAFADELLDAEIYALTKFVMTVRAEAAAGDSPLDRVLSDPDLVMFTMPMSQVSQSNGRTIYNLASDAGGCSTDCHGEAGKLIDFDGNGTFVREYSLSIKAWDVLHKIRFGKPGSSPYMPGLAEYDNPDFEGVQAAIDILAYIQMGIYRSSIVGGRVYDDWAVEMGTDVPGPNPLLAFAPDQAAASAVSDVDGWRCSQCHGYDFEGGAFGFTNNLVNLKEINSWTLDYVFDVIKNGYEVIDPATNQIIRVHKYAGIVHRPRLWSAAKFLVEEVFDTHTVIRPITGGLREPQASAVNGEALYNGLSLLAFPDGTMLDCVTCHGADGKLATRADGSATDIFLLSWTDPWKFFHQTKFGTPVFTMGDIVMPGTLTTVRAEDEHYSGNHDVADVQMFSQKIFSATSAAAVANIKRMRIEENTRP